jgi:hypothetical protein
MLRPANITVRRGHVVVHVQNTEDLPAVLAALDSPKTTGLAGDAAVIETLAACSQRLLDAAGRALPQLRFRGLRDVLFHNRGRLSSTDCKFLGDLNTTFGLLRHLPMSELSERSSSIAGRLAPCDPSSDALGVLSDIDLLQEQDPWATASSIGLSASGRSKVGFSASSGASATPSSGLYGGIASSVGSADLVADPWGSWRKPASTLSSTPNIEPFVAEVHNYDDGPSLGAVGLLTSPSAADAATEPNYTAAAPLVPSSSGLRVPCLGCETACARISFFEDKIAHLYEEASVSGDGPRPGAVGFLSPSSATAAASAPSLDILRSTNVQNENVPFHTESKNQEEVVAANRVVVQQVAFEDQVLVPLYCVRGCGPLSLGSGSGEGSCDACLAFLEESDVLTCVECYYWLCSSCAGRIRADSARRDDDTDDDTDDDVT